MAWKINAKFSGENWRGSAKFIDVAGNNWSRWCRNLVQKFSLKFSAQTAKSRINIGKFGDISLAFVRERKNEPKQKVANLYEKIANLYENSDKFTKVANEWLASKTRLKPRIVFWFKRQFEVLLLQRFGEKNQRNHAKRCRLRANETIKAGKLQTALKVLGALNSLFKFAILHEYTKHKFIACIDKTAL